MGTGPQPAAYANSATGAHRFQLYESQRYLSTFHPIHYNGVLMQPDAIPGVSSHAIPLIVRTL